MASAANESLASVAGLAFLDAHGHVRRSAARGPLATLDALPMPAWDLVDLARYGRIWRRRHGHHAVNLTTTRGCPYHCNWCAKPIYGQRYAVRSVPHVVAEMAHLVRLCGPDRVAFVDDVFGLQPGWIERFADAVNDADLGLPFSCLMRADQLRELVVEALARANCQMVWIGAESGSQRVLDAMEKGIRVHEIRDAAASLHRAGIRVGFFLQFGYPGETMRDIEETFALVRDAAPDDIGVSVSYPLPGTPFYDRVRAELGSKQNWVDSDDLAMLYRAAYPPAFYRLVHGAIHHEHRTRRLSAAVAGLASRPWRMRPGDARRLASLAVEAARMHAARYRMRRVAGRLVTAAQAAAPDTAGPPVPAPVPSRQGE